MHYNTKSMYLFIYLYISRTSINRACTLQKREKGQQVCRLKVGRQDFLHTHQCQLNVKLYSISAHVQESIFHSGINQSDSLDQNSHLHHSIPYSSIN